MWLGFAMPPSGVAAQDLITSQDVVRFESPPPDHQIAYDGGELQFAKLRLPEGAGPHPLVIFVHGGCWLSQFDIQHAGLLEQGIADEGYAVWSIEYRRVGDEGGGWPGTFRDVGRAADHLRMVAAQYDLDLTKVVASGHSAGGHLALWLAARSTLPEDSELYVADPLTIHGVFALAPAPDLEALHESRVCGSVIDRLMGGSPDEFPGRYRDASPMQLAPIDVPQTLVIGTLDRAWAPGGRAYFERAAAAGDTRVQVVEAKESGHFEMIVPTTSSWPVVRDALHAIFRELGN